MRRVIFSTIALFALLFNSCELPSLDNSNNDNAPDVEKGNAFRIVSDSIIEIPAEGGNAEIEYIIDTVVEDAELTATSTAEWISNITVGDTVTFDVEKNTSIEARLDYIALKYASTTLYVGVDQAGRVVSADATMQVTSDRTINFEGDGGKGTITYTITGGEEGDKPIVESNQEWIHSIVVDSQEVNFVVDANPNSSSRRGNITLSYGTYNFTIIIKQDAQTNVPILTVSSQSVRLGESVTFTVTLANSDITADAKIYDHYNASIEIPNPYTPTEIGELTLVAKYNGSKSNILTINVVPSNTPLLPEDSNEESYDFNQRILLIDHTGAGCPKCPAVKEVFKAAEDNVNYNYKFNVVYSYSFNFGEACYSSAAKTLWNYFQEVCSTGDYLTGYPSFTTNYCFNYTGKFNVLERINQFWDENVSASVALSTKFETSGSEKKLIVNAAIKSSKSQSYKLSLWLLEDDVYATQSGATASWMHTHHNVMRDAITGISKSDIAGIDFGYVKEYTTYERVLTYDLFVGEKWNINNCKLIAIISAPSDKYNGKYEVVTTTICDLNGSVGFDYKK